MQLLSSAAFSIELERIRPALKTPIEFLESDGIMVFPLYGASGGISTEFMSVMKNGPWDCPDIPPEPGLHDLGDGRKAYIFRWTRDAMAKLTKGDIQNQILNAVTELTNA